MVSGEAESVAATEGSIHAVERAGGRVDVHADDGELAIAVVVAEAEPITAVPVGIGIADGQVGTLEVGVGRVGILNLHNVSNREAQGRWSVRQ